MAALSITQTLDNLLPNVLHEIIIDYYGIKDNIDICTISMCVHNNILYVLNVGYVIAYDSEFNEIKKYKTHHHMTDLSVDDYYIYTISTNFNIYVEKINKETNEKIYLEGNHGDCITVYDNKLYVYTNSQISILCSTSGILLETIDTIDTEALTGYNILFRENALFIICDYNYVHTKNLITINNNYDIYVNMNKISLYKKNTLYKKYGELNVPHDNKSISELIPIDEIIVDINLFKNNEQTLESKIQNISYVVIRCIAATDNKIYACVEYNEEQYKIIVYDICQNKIKRKRK
jgi:hypothetical protein